MLFQLFLYRAEVHRSLNYLEIVRNLQFFRVNGRLENPRRLQLRHILNHSLGRLFPVIEYLSELLVDLRDGNVLYFGFVEEVFGQFGVVNRNFLEFLQRDRSVLLAVFDLQREFL